jgi:hypothetical protein
VKISGWSRPPTTMDTDLDFADLCIRRSRPNSKDFLDLREHNVCAAANTIYNFDGIVVGANATFPDIMPRPLVDHYPGSRSNDGSPCGI